MLGIGRSRSLRFTACAAGVVACALTAGSAAANFPGKGLDDTPSMGVFRIVVDPKFAPYFTCLPISDPFWDPNTNKLTSPVLVDPNTIIQRSDPRNVHDNTYLPCGDGGASPPDTPISDLDFVKIPAGFEYLLPEVHTNVYSLNMQSLGDRACGITIPCSGQPFPVSVKAGLGQGLSKCPGEVASPGGKSFPAESFFNVFVQVDLGSTFILYNDAAHPLVITASGLGSFPPDVVYIHGVTAAVPVLTGNSGNINDGCLPGGNLNWGTGELFGYLVLAGHSTDASCADTSECRALYNQAITNGKEMPLPGSIPAVSGWGMVALLIMLLGTGIWFFRNRSQVEEASA